MYKTNQIVNSKRLKDKRVKKVIVIDTETTPYYEELPEPFYKQGLTPPPQAQEVEAVTLRDGRNGFRWKVTSRKRELIFDIGWVIADKSGNILKAQHYLVKEVFSDIKLMRHGFYFEKYPEYLVRLSDGETTMKTWLEVTHALEDDCSMYGIHQMYAYNMSFDKRAIEDTHKIVGHATQFPLFKTWNITAHCLWGMAAETFLNTKQYIRTALTEGWLTGSGNISTKAEHAYKYISKDLEFIEAHTALADAIIEVAILARCYASKKHMTMGIIANPWKIVNDKALEYGLKAINNTD